MITININDQWYDIVKHYRGKHPEILGYTSQEEWNFIWEDLRKKFGVKKPPDNENVDITPNFQDASCYTMFRLMWP